MATISNRLTSTGNLLVNGSIDEFTGAPVIDANTVVWLDAAQTASYSGTGNSWNSLTSQANVATLYAGTAFSTNRGGYFTFDGVDDYVQMAPPSNIGTSTVTTVEVWANIKSIVGMVYGFTSYDIYMAAGGAMGFNTGNSDVYGITVANVTALGLANNWKHYCYVMYNNVSLGGTTYNNNKIYVNGVAQPLQQVTGNISSTIRSLTGNLTIGGWTNNTAQYKPSMDVSAIKLYDRELTAAEVLQNYNALAPRYGLTANTAGNTISRTTANTILSSQFDEVTYNASNPTIKNIYNYTQDFTNAYWQKAGTLTISNTSAVLAPDGTATAQIANVGGAGTYPYIRVAGGGAVVPATTGTTYTVSSYVKYINQQYMTIVNEDSWTGGMSVRFDILNSTVGTLGANVSSANITSLDNGWKRISVTYKPVPAGITYWNPQPIRVGSYDGTNYSGSQVYIWGAQLEASSSATIYQPKAASGTLVSSTTVRKIDQGANYYIQGQFDELTGAPVIDGNLKFWIDAAQSNSYSGSGATWYDISTSQSNVTLYNSPTYSSSVTGGNIKFTPASTQYGDTATNLGNMPKWTAEAWVKVNASLTGQVTSAVTNQYNLSNALNYSIGTNKAPTDYNLCVGFFDGAWHNTTGFVPTLDTWYQVVGTYDGTTLIQYVNGTANGSAISYTGTASSGGNTRIARRWDDTTVSTNLFPGDIAVVRIYNRALTADEVSQNFNAHRRRFNL